MDLLRMCLLYSSFFLAAPVLQAIVPGSADEEDVVPKISVPSFQGSELNPQAQDNTPQDVPLFQYGHWGNENKFNNFFKTVESLEKKEINMKKQSMYEMLMNNRNRYWHRFKEQSKYSRWLQEFRTNTPCGQQEIQPIWKNRRVIGGLTAIPGSWPWMASLFFDIIGQHWCAGTLISDRWVLTARHCFDFPFNNTRDWTVRLGKFDITQEEETEEEFEIKAIIGHPRYNPANFDNDIALLRLDRPVEFTEFISPICLEPKFPPSPESGVVTGWGKVNENSTQLSSVLKQVRIPVVNQQNCKTLYEGKITPSMMCAGPVRGGRDSCSGDSGGPLQHLGTDNRWYLQGVASWGGASYKECGRPLQPGVYTRVARYRGWIYRQIYRNSVATE